MLYEKNDKGIFLNGEKVKYAHFRDVAIGVVNPRQGMTIAYIGENDNPKAVGLSYCSADDNFVYAQGRIRALGRLMQGIGKDAPSDSVDGVDEALGLLPKFLKGDDTVHINGVAATLGFTRY